MRAELKLSKYHIDYHTYIHNIKPNDRVESNLIKSNQIKSDQIKSDQIIYQKYRILHQLLELANATAQHE